MREVTRSFANLGPLLANGLQPERPIFIHVIGPRDVIYVVDTYGGTIFSGQFDGQCIAAAPSQLGVAATHMRGMPLTRAKRSQAGT